jgi:hypothetical protein
MAHRIKEFEVTLEDAIEVHVKGQPVEGTTVLLIAPSAKNRKEAFNMKQIFTRAITSMQKNASQEELSSAKARKAEATDDKGPSGEEILMMILASDQDFDMFNEQFRKLLCHGCATICGEPLNDHLYGKLSLDDAEKILAEYLEHFLMKSLLQ